MGRRSFFVVFVTMAGSLSSATWANSRAAIEAWNAGDFPLAIQEWQEPAQRGDAEAQFRLGEAYRLGKGVEQDLIKAEEMFARAAAQGHLEAANNYGLLLFHRGEKKQALPYLRAASERGDARAQYLLGLAYFNADNVERDWPRRALVQERSRSQRVAAPPLPSPKPGQLAAGAFSLAPLPSPAMPTSYGTGSETGRN